MLSNLKKQRKLIVIKDVCYERVKQKLIIMLLFRRKGTFLTPIKRSAVPANDTINATFE